MQSELSQIQYPTQPMPSAPVLSTKDWIITILLQMIPIVNIIMLIVWAFGNDTNPNKANFARASLIWMGIAIVASFFFCLLFAGALIAAINQSPSSFY